MIDVIEIFGEPVDDKTCWGHIKEQIDWSSEYALYHFQMELCGSFENDVGHDLVTNKIRERLNHCETQNHQSKLIVAAQLKVLIKCPSSNIQSQVSLSNQ